MKNISLEILTKDELENLIYEAEHEMNRRDDFNDLVAEVVEKLNELSDKFPSAACNICVDTTMFDLLELIIREDDFIYCTNK